MQSISRRHLLTAGAAAIFVSAAPTPLLARTVKDAQGDDVALGKLERILSIGGDVTEIIFAPDYTDRDPKYVLSASGDRVVNRSR